MWSVFIPALTIMGKRFRYFISSVISALGFFLYVSLPVETRYFGLLAGVVLVIFCVWFGLGLIFTDDFYTRMMSVILPSLFFLGFGLFSVLLPDGFLTSMILSVVFGFVIYTLFLVENVFLVAIGFKTVPLYRAAFTVSLMLTLFTSFFVFNSLISFRLYFWWNFILTFLISMLFFLYQFWAVTIESVDDGKSKNLKVYYIIPSLVMAEISAILSFLPVGIFKGSIYLVTAMYIMIGLVSAGLRERLFKKTWIQFGFILIGLLMAIFFSTQWRE